MTFAEGRIQRCENALPLSTVLRGKAWSTSVVLHALPRQTVGRGRGGGGGSESGGACVSVHSWLAVNFIAYRPTSCLLPPTLTGRANLRFQDHDISPARHAALRVSKGCGHTVSLAWYTLTHAPPYSDHQPSQDEQMLLFKITVLPSQPLHLPSHFCETWLGK